MLPSTTRSDCTILDHCQRLILPMPPFTTDTIKGLGWSIPLPALIGQASLKRLRTPSISESSTTTISNSSSQEESLVGQDQPLIRTTNTHTSAEEGLESGATSESESESPGQEDRADPSSSSSSIGVFIFIFIFTSIWSRICCCWHYLCSFIQSFASPTSKSSCQKLPLPNQSVTHTNKKYHATYSYRRSSNADMPLFRQTTASLLRYQPPTAPLPEMPDDIWFHIFSHLHGKDGPSTYYKSSTIIEILIPLFHVSKEIQGILIRYAQEIPQEFSYTNVDLEAVAWAIKHKMKLGLLNLNSGNSYLKASACLHLLKRCNIKDMHTFRIDMRWFRETDPQRAKRIMMHAGISREILSSSRTNQHGSGNGNGHGHGHEKPTLPKSDCQQKQYVDYLTEHVKELKNLSIVMYKARFYTPILNNFSDTLQELTLSFLGGGKRKPLKLAGAPPETYANDFDTITTAIEHMPQLKKLTVHSYVKGTLNIRSKSLEKIDTSQCGLAIFWVPQCICPSLKMFISVYGVHDEKKSGIKPVTRFTSTQIIDKWQDPNRTVGIEFRVKEYPFVGLEVPDSCIVRLYTL